MVVTGAPKLLPRVHLFPRRVLMLLRGAVALSVAAVLAAVALRAVEDRKGDLDGTWVPYKVTVDGKDVPADQIAEFKEVIKGTTYKSYHKGKLFAGGTYKFDRAKNPKHVDTSIEEGPGKGQTFLAIYKVEGDRM